MSISCPKCKSLAVGQIRLDSDWCDGGDWTMANDDSHYDKEQKREFEGNSRPNIDCYICCQCNFHFEEPIK